MGKRKQRRERITAAYEELRAAIAAALGAAQRRHQHASTTHRQREFALAIAEQSVTKVSADPNLLGSADDPACVAALKQAQAERDEVFADWTDSGPPTLSELVTQHAPGSASQPWQDWLGTLGTADSTSAHPLLWRIGDARIPESPRPEPFPAVVPLLDESHISITSPVWTDPSSVAPHRDNPRQARENLVQNLLLRVLSYYVPGSVRVHVWDVAQLTGTLPGLYPLTRAELLTAYDPTRLDDLLDELSGHIRRIHTHVLLGAYSSLRAMTAETGHRGEPWRVAVLLGDGKALSDEQQQRLQRIARGGLACGIQLIVADIPFSANTAVESVSLLGRDANGAELARSSMTGPHAEITLDSAPSREKVTRACSLLAEDFQDRRSRIHTFTDLIPRVESPSHFDPAGTRPSPTKGVSEPRALASNETQLWTHTSVSGLHAPVGFSEGDPVCLMLGDSSPHALIGGPSGAGKTNFLFTMLGSLAARYSPSELELYLLDFKEGVSFAQLAPGRRDPSWLPHAKLVGVNVNTDREFGLALLRFLADEMRRRADAAKIHEVTKLEELRAEDPYGHWPRIVAVIDEFQYLFSQRDTVSAEATELLEDVARRGRSQGIHLVLASQDVSGIEAFWGKSAIFEQFIVRIALPKARRVLADQNDTALRLPRWHAVLNHESGVADGNEIARIPNASSKGSFDQLQSWMWQHRSVDASPPRLFDGSQLPALAGVDDFCRLKPNVEPAPRALLGQVIDVNGTAAAVRLGRTPGRNIAVLGSVVKEAASVLGSAALSLAHQHKPGDVRFTVVNLVDDTTQETQALATALRESHHDVSLLELADLGGELARLNTLVEERSQGRVGTSELAPEFLLLYGADAAASKLDEKEPPPASTATQGLSIGQGPALSGHDRLRTILKRGPESRVHVLGWWRSVQRLKNTLGIGPVDDIGAWVACDVHGSELGPFAAGQVVGWSPRAHRALFFDRSTHSRPEVILPFDLAGLLGGVTRPAEPNPADPSAENPVENMEQNLERT